MKHLKNSRVGFILLALVLILIAAAAGCAGKVNGDGKYDYDYSQVSSDPANLTGRVRVISLAVSDNTGVVFSQSTMGWVRDNEVVVPYQLFYLPMPDGSRVPSWYFSELAIELTILPDPDKEDVWKKEKLGDILNKEDLASGVVSFAVVKRVHPIIKTTGAEDVLGKYDELSAERIDKVLYTTSQINGRVTVERAVISEVRADNDGKKLFYTPGQIVFSQLGGLAFALRDGRAELVGLLSPMEVAADGSGMAYIYYLDIQQIVDYIGTIAK